MINLLSKSIVKTQLGIEGGIYDIQIDAMIPIVSSDVRRILGNNFDKYVSAVFVVGSTNIDFGILNFDDVSYSSGEFAEGQVIQGTGIPADTYLSNYNAVTGIYTLSAAATISGIYVVPTILIGQWPAISKMIWYKISKMSIDAVGKRKVSAESYGGISKSYAQSELNSQYDYPQVLIDDLGVPFAQVG